MPAPAPENSAPSQKTKTIKAKHPKNVRTAAIDGPSGSGKSTLAKQLAERLGVECLDTGAMYRAVAYAVLKSAASLEDEKAVARISKKARIKILPEKVEIDGEDITAEIRTSAVTEAASKVAQNPAVRRHQRKRQQRWIRKRKGGVLEGRDIGTVILPKADIKIYIDADPAVRAERRALESGREKVDVLKSMEERDETDRERKFNPLKKAADAIVVDTSARTVAEVIKEIFTEQTRRHEAYLMRGLDFSEPFTLPSRIGMILIGRGAYVIFRTYFRGKVYNRKGIPRRQSLIYAPAGHRSNLDTPVVGGVAKAVLKYMAKDSLYKSRFWSRFMHFCGAFPVRRDQQDMTALRTAQKVLERGESLVLFPEGARQEGPVIKPLLDGVVWLSAVSGVGILPIGIAGGDKAMPIGKKTPMPKRITVVVGDVIPAPSKSLSKSERKQKSEELRQILQGLFDKAKEG